MGIRAGPRHVLEPEGTSSENIAFVTNLKMASKFMWFFFSLLCYFCFRGTHLFNWTAAILAVSGQHFMLCSSTCYLIVCGFTICLPQFHYCAFIQITENRSKRPSVWIRLKNVLVFCLALL